MIPSYYNQEIKKLDWEELKIPKVLNISIVILSLISILVGQYFVSLMQLIHLIKQLPLLILTFPLLIFVYIVLHEFIHGILMKYYSGISAQYGISGPFIFAKSEAIFSKEAYLIITMAPMFVLGASSIVLSLFISGTGIWFGIFVWVMNLYASRGDLQAVMAVKELPRTYGIQDNGYSLNIYQINNMYNQ
ncbi:DUF3267 domain-containing protein [Guptibacillus sedimenti]|uniref:DUF3267 domain-containing protein n=1 Tax=Guptibacillus sedimenti TaxID=3025680 RepID=UPI0023616107|nr:DUF3267 domain-containing protein [Pseudalkalibacillus sedimenti]